MEGHEKVFVVRRSDFFGGRWPQGFLRLGPAEADGWVSRFERAGFFAPRAAAERDPTLKQIVPYCLVTRETERDLEVLVVERLREQGEARLHGLLSLGLGGHVEPGDRQADVTDLFLHALRRELREELVIPDLERLQPELVGLLNDDSTEVGRVHTGLVYRLDVSGTPGARSPGIRIREIRKMRGGFRPLASRQPRARPNGPPRVAQPPELWQDPDRLESWSRILLEAAWLRPGESWRDVPTS